MHRRNANMRKLTIGLIAFAIIFSACGAIVRAAKQKIELESASMPLG
jgi:hypothetical protein